MDLTALYAKQSGWEGKRLVVYDDATGQPITPGTLVKGNATIGVGTNLVAGITDAESLYLWNNRIQTAIHYASLLNGYDSCNEARQMVLVDMTFGMGYGTMTTFTTFLGLVAASEYNAAADDMLQTAWAHQVGQRSKDLANIMRTGVWA